MYIYVCMYISIYVYLYYTYILYTYCYIYIYIGGSSDETAEEEADNAQPVDQGNHILYNIYIYIIYIL